MKRTLVILAVLLVVAAVILAAAGILPIGLDTKLAQLGVNPFTTAATPTGQVTTKQEQVTVQLGTVSAYIKATGNLEAKDEASLSFEINGTVADIYVERGATVNKGDKLAQLDTTDLELAVTKAQIDLDKAEAELAQTTADPDPDDVVSAQAALDSAQASHDALLAGQTDTPHG